MGKNPGTMMRDSLLVTMLMERGPRQQPDNLIITKTSTGYHSVTYREHTRTVRRLANALSAAGVRRGDNVATMMWNSARHLACFQTVPSMGCCVHTLNVRLGARELGYIVRHAADRVMIVDYDLVEKIEQCADADLASVELFVVCGRDEGPGGWGAERLQRLAKVVDWDDFVSQHPDTVTWPRDIDENDAMALCYTSGTTGAPKGVAYSHRSTYIHTLAYCMPDYLSLSGTDVICPVVPMFHALGWGLPFMGLMLGVRFVLTSRYNDAGSILRCCVDHAVAMTAAVPAVWQTVRSALAADPAAFKGRFRVKRLMCGGTAPPADLMRWFFEEHGTEFVQVYGLTETNPLMTASKYAQKLEHVSWPADRKFGNVTKAGVLGPGLEWKLVSPDSGDDVPHDGESVGELLVRGPTITASYYRSPGVGKFTGGWMATGDIAAIDAGGYLRIADRAKDLIKSGGEWISSVDVENAVASIQGVDQCAVVGVHHPKWDERPIAVIVSKKQSVDVRSVRDQLSKSFAKYQLPDDVLVWSALPFTGTGKVDKKEIRRLLRESGYVLPELRGKAKL